MKRLIALLSVFVTLATYGFERQKTKTGNFVVGVRLKADSDDDSDFLK